MQQMLPVGLYMYIRMDYIHSSYKDWLGHCLSSLFFKAIGVASYTQAGRDKSRLFLYIYLTKKNAEFVGLIGASGYYAYNQINLLGANKPGGTGV